MAERLDDRELVSFKELLMSNSIQVDAVSQLLIEKGVCTEDVFYNKLREVMRQYQEKQILLTSRLQVQCSPGDIWGAVWRRAEINKPFIKRRIGQVRPIGARSGNSRQKPPNMDLKSKGNTSHQPPPIILSGPYHSSNIRLFLPCMR